MKTANKIIRQSVAKVLFIGLAFGQFAQTTQAASTDIANIPMAVNNSVTPNVLIILDNSESMDGYMAGTLVSGADPLTRGNVGRTAMRNLALTPYRTAFNWGLMSFQIGSPTLYGTYVYYLGDSAGGVPTDVVAGVSTPTAGMNFTTAANCLGYVPSVGTYPNASPALPGNTGTCTTATPAAAMVIAAGTTSGSAAVTYAPTGLLVSGTPVSGLGIPTGTTISAVNTGVGFTLNNQATVTNAAATLTLTVSNCTRSSSTAIWTQASPKGGTYTWHDNPDTYATWTGNRCIANPQPVTVGGKTYGYTSIAYSSDDSTINDVLYYGGYSATPAINQSWAPATNTSNPTSYQWWLNRSAGGLADTTWNAADFSSAWFSGTLTPTDAGYIPVNNGASLPNDISRSLYLPRAWGYGASPSGGGVLNEAIMADSATHYNTLMTLMGNETNGATGEIKNASFYTPSVGTLASAQSYFSGSSTPVKAACQQNFIMFVTDGLPTATTSGSMYPLSQQVDTCSWSTSNDTCTSNPNHSTLGTAVNDVITQLIALRTTTVPSLSSTQIDGSQHPGDTPSGKFDIQTYIVGLGDTVVNANNLSGLNAMAFYGGGMNTALLATDQPTFEAAINAITSDITAKIGSSAAVAVANAQVTKTNDASYASTYNSGTWSGDLNAYSLDLVTGLPLATSLWTAGGAQAQLDSMTATSRLIATSKDATGPAVGEPFEWASITSTQQALLNSPLTPPGPSDNAAVLAYLRGWYHPSGGINDNSPLYRSRAHLLGDIVDAEPVVVNAPSNTYMDAGYKGSTSTFLESNATRTHMVYQAANDGMLHAFYAQDGVGAPSPCVSSSSIVCGGQEAWAYIPNLVMGTLSALSQKTGFTHQYRVDGTPAAGDVAFSDGTGWHTILVGGLGKGGRGFYALDVTNPDHNSNSPTDTATLTEAGVASKALWEFPPSAPSVTLNVGYSFGKPVLVKTKAKGWVVLVTSGYNNGTNSGDSGGDGEDHLFVLNPQTGALIADLSTGTFPTAAPKGCTGTAGGGKASPCGMAQVSAYVQNPATDNTTDYVYGGDLKGNVWRFDLSGTSASSWAVSRMAVLVDGSGNPQPITTAPELGQLTSSNTSYRFLYIGTGEYLGNSDVSTTNTQSMYALVDPITRNSTSDTLYATSLPPNTSSTSSLRSTLVLQTLATSGTTRTIPTPNTVNLTQKNGWYVDLGIGLNPTSGERVNNAPVLSNGVLVFTTNIPSSVTCVPGGSSWLYNLNALTGAQFFDPNTGATAPPAVSLGNVLASRVVLVTLPNGKVIELVRSSDNKTTANVAPIHIDAFGKRTSWRQLSQ